MASAADAAALERAAALLRQGKPEAAEPICREILSRTPTAAAATHLCGLIRRQLNDLSGSETLLSRSIELEPGRAEFHFNLANLLRHQSRLAEARDCYQRSVSLDGRNAGARLGLVRTLNDLGQRAAAEAEARQLIAVTPRDAQAWSALAMTLRDQGRLFEAESAYDQAIKVNPTYAPAHYNMGSVLVELERTEQALAALQRAQTLGVGGFELAFMQGRALLQAYRIEEAERSFAVAVSLRPQHAQAQLNLARIRFMRSDPAFSRDLRLAAQAHPSRIELQVLLGELLQRAGDHPAAESVLRDCIKQHGAVPEVRAALAHLLLTEGRLAEAEIEAAGAAADRPENAQIAEHWVSILLAQGKAAEAAAVVSTQRARFPLDQGWLAYEASVARLTGLARYAELYDYDRFVHSYDLSAPPGWSSLQELNDALAKSLGERHPFSSHPLDQSLRNGSQTARSLETETDAAIQAMVRCFAEPLGDYCRSLGSDPDHPLLARNTGKTVFSGIWSIQLRRSGFHVNHFHPHGWVSSAYYVAVPSECEDADAKSGWLKFGEPRFPVPGAQPARHVQPRAGRLVLFPSYMWHGTNPILGEQTRTTIAFDAVPQP
jgi:tetratricopeptide (TPR) repeat protein